MVNEAINNTPINSFNSNKIMITKEEDSKNPEPMSPFSSMKPKIKDTDTEGSASPGFDLNNNQNLEIILTDDLLYTKKKQK